MEQSVLSATLTNTASRVVSPAKNANDLANMPKLTRGKRFFDSNSNYIYILLKKYLFKI